jgi:hypothetical protein
MYTLGHSGCQNGNLRSCEATFLRHFVLVFSFRPFITRPQFSLALEPTGATNEMEAV